MISIQTSLLLAFVVTVVAAVPSSELPSVKHVMNAEELKEAATLLQSALASYSEGQNYTLKKIIYGTKEILLGTTYKMKVELTKKNDVTKECDVVMVFSDILVFGVPQNSLKIACNGEDEISLPA